MPELFPRTPYANCESFAIDYFKALNTAVLKSNLEPLNAVAELLRKTIASDGFIYICGNGGSAGIANHSLCDFLKCVRTDTNLSPRMMSLSAHTEMNSALSNDISHDEIFAYQLSSMARPGDLLWTISSSGDSENVVRAIAVAKEIGLNTVSFSGFAGGRTRDIADVNVHVDACNYGVVEDTHQSFIHILTQYLRMTHMDQTLIAESKF